MVTLPSELINYSKVEDEVVEAEFQRIDSNQDGQLSYDELDCAIHAGQENTDDLGKCAYSTE